MYSAEGYARGAYMSFQPTSYLNWIMIGLNTDPTTSASYTDIDYAWYIQNGGALDIFESGSPVGSFGTYTLSTVLNITYDGFNIRYWKDGVLQRTVARAIGLALYLDSSFYSVSTTEGITNCVFGPMGEAGTSGVNGSNGSSGTSGVNGNNGSSGTSGTSGAQGPQGPQGPEGPQGPAGTSGTSGVSGGGGASCPDVVRIAAMSGKFQVTSKNYPDLNALRIGNDGLGWSYGEYDLALGSDVFGTMLALKPYDAYCAIPLPTDLLPGDVIKICGNAWSFNYGNLPYNQINVGVGYIVCSDITNKINSPVFTLIPTFQTFFGSGGTACFSDQIELGITLPACNTMLIVGLLGSDQDGLLEGLYRFTYTLDAIKYCAGANLLIRYCCDPAYYEIIANNGVAIGSVFSDTDGYCWTVFEETTLPITSTRTKATDYVHCAACIENNPCAPNYVVESCCKANSEIFVSVMPGVSVGDTFVDTYGFCWSVTGSEFIPITNVVFPDTVYNETTCNDETCIISNPCPIMYVLQSCCYRGALIGTTSSAIIGTGWSVFDVFVDTNGICWLVKGVNVTPGVPTLPNVIPSTTYANEACNDCISTNPCPETIYFTIQNCCTEDIEVVQFPLGAIYAPGQTLGVRTSPSNNRECFKILSFDVTGTPTLTIDSVDANYQDCRDCIASWDPVSCQ